MMISTKDRLPTYGEPVFIKIDGVFQHVTYMLEGADDVPDWFEVCNDERYQVRWDKVESWIYVDDLVKLLEGK